MEVIVILVGISLVAASGFLLAFFWALKKGQFDDLTTPAIRMLLDSNKDRTGDEE